MTDSPGVPAALGIEAVEWLAEGGENLTVRVTGRWRRRRPTWTGQPLLVMEAQGRRHRFPAMPEPPSLSGTAPGMWRMSFAVPAALAPHIGSRGWLQLGAVVVPLPIQVRLAAPVTANSGPVVARQLESTELAVQASRRRAAEAVQAAADLAVRVRQLEEELQLSRAESGRVAAAHDERRRAVLAAEQREHAERTRREELRDELTRRRRWHEQAQAAASERIAELETEAASLRRRHDEARQEAAAARCAVTHLEEQLAEMTRSLLAGQGRGEALRAERALAARMPAAASVAVPVPREPDWGAPRLGAERQLISARSPRAAETSVAELRRQLADRTAVEAMLRAAADSERAARERAEAEVVRLEQELRESATRTTRAHEAIEELRVELQAAREAMKTNGAPPDPPDPPVIAADPPSEPLEAAPDTAGGPVDGARLEAALARLRETTPESALQTASPVGRPWLEPVFRALAKRDPTSAGRLAVVLLPAQPLVHARPLAYDLVLSELGCVAVTSADGEVRVDVRDAARPQEQTQLVITGELSGLGRLLSSRRVRRRVGRRARAKGDRSALKALRALVGAPLGLERLYAAGVRPEPPLVMLLASVMIDPEWTKGEDFMIAHRDPEASASGAALRVCDKAPVSVGDASELRPGSTTIVCPGGALLGVLAGTGPADLTVEGDARPLAVVQSWLKRAQSG
jgi:hypothetical protein